MSDSNRQTIQSYQDHANEYIAGTPQTLLPGLEKLLDAAVDEMGLEASILEIGSAFGRDAAYLQSLGYSVDCTDATPAFVDYLNSHGFEATIFNAITNEIPGKYDLILALAVLLHFTPQEFSLALQKICAALKPGGRFVFSLKQGDGEKWSSQKLGAPRYFCFWQENQVLAELKKAGFARTETCNCSYSISTSGNRWLGFIARRS